MDFIDFPPELLCEFFSYLDCCADLLSVLMTCKHLYSSGRVNLVWKHACFQLIPSYEIRNNILDAVNGNYRRAMKWYKWGRSCSGIKAECLFGDKTTLCKNICAKHKQDSNKAKDCTACPTCAYLQPDLFNTPLKAAVSWQDPCAKKYQHQWWACQNCKNVAGFCDQEEDLSCSHCHRWYCKSCAATCLRSNSNSNSNSNGRNLLKLHGGCVRCEYYARDKDNKQ